MRSGIWTVLLLGTLPFQAWGRPWQVEKDGTGDFTVIQDALDAAAAGDTVRVGSGRFADFRKVTRPQDGFEFYAIAWITKPLVLLGAGMDQTTVGPSTVVIEIAGLTSGGIYLDVDAAGARMEGINVENMQFPATVLTTVEWVRNRLKTTKRPTTQETWPGLTLLSGSQIQVIESHFSGELPLFTASPQVTGLSVSKCHFGPGGKGLSLSNGATNAQVAECSFSQLEVGVSIALSSSATIRHSSFHQIEIVAIDMDQGAAIVRDCTIEEGARYPLRVNIGRLEIYDSRIGGGTLATILTWGDMIVRNTHLLNAGGLTVDSRGSASRVVDLQGNWWGTTNLATIQAWVSIFGNSTVIVEPILDHPVAVQKSSLGDLKLRFQKPGG